MFSRERVGRKIDKIKENISWKEPESVGTVRVYAVSKPTPQTWIYYLENGNEYIKGSRIHSVSGPADLFEKGDIAEVIVRKKILRNVVRRGFPQIKVALRKPKDGCCGILTEGDRKQLQIMFDRIGNERGPFYNRPLSKRLIEALEGKVEEIKKEIIWKEPESVGTARILSCTESSPETHMYQLRCGEEDITGIFSIFAPAGYCRGNC